MGDTSLLPPCKIIELVTLPEILCVFLVDASIDLVEVEAISVVVKCPCNGCLYSLNA